MDAPLLGDEEPVAVEEDQTVCWSLSRRLVFCFVCAYLVLFIVGGFTNSVWSPLNIWLGVHLFHLSGQAVTIVRTGSGDTALAYVQEFWVVVLAVLISLAWQLVDRKRANYRRADTWLRILFGTLSASYFFSTASGNCFRFSSAH